MTSETKITRRNFFNRLAGRTLTVAVAAAEAAKNDRIVNRLLRVKDKLNRRRTR